MSFWAAAAAAAGTGTLGVLVISTGALGRISVGTRPGDTGPRYGLTSAVALVARLGVTENMGCNETQVRLDIEKLYQLYHLANNNCNPCFYI